MAKEQKSFFIENTRIPLMVTEYDWTYAEMHWHNYWEVLMQKDGITHVAIGNDQFEMHPGDIVVIPPNQLHETYCIGKRHKLLLLQFHTSILLPVMELDNSQRYTSLWINGGYRVKSRIMEEDEQIFGLALERLLEANCHRKIGYEYEVYANLFHFFASLLEKNYIVLSPVDHERKNALIEVTPALRFIDEHFDERISQRELAEMCFLSQTHFSKQFKKAVGQNMVDYINEIRMKEAGRLLRTRQISVTEISALTGFASVNYFNKVFKNYYKMNPREYKGKIV